MSASPRAPHPDLARERRFQDLAVGQAATLHKQITAQAVEDFARISGDHNPLHLDQEFAAATPFGRPVVHGVLLASYVSALVGVHLPGAGSLWAQQAFHWRLPVFVGDQIEFTLTITHKSEGTRTVAVKVKAVNQDGYLVMDGHGLVMLPAVNGTGPPRGMGRGGKTAVSLFRRSKRIRDA